MKRTMVYLVAALLLSLPPPADAQHSLLPGDVLESGRFSTELRYDFARFASGRNTVGNATGEWTEYAGIGVARFTAGLGAGLGISASIPYTFFDSNQITVSGTTSTSRRRGIGDLSLGAKWRFVRTPTVEASLGLTVKLDSAGRYAGTSTTEFSPLLALTFNRTTLFAPFIVYAPNFVKDRKAPGSHGAIVGTNLGTGGFQLIAMAQARFFGDQAYDEYGEYRGALESVIALNKTVSLTPSFGYTWREPVHSLRNAPDRASQNGFNAGIGVYLQF